MTVRHTYTARFDWQYPDDGGYQTSKLTVAALAEDDSGEPRTVVISADQRGGYISLSLTVEDATSLVEKLQEALASRAAAVVGVA